MRHYKTKTQRTLQKLLDNPDPRIQLSAAKALKSLEKKQAAAQAEKDALKNPPEWYLKLPETNPTGNSRHTWRVIHACEGHLARCLPGVELTADDWRTIEEIRKSSPHLVKIAPQAQPVVAYF